MKAIEIERNLEGIIEIHFGTEYNDTHIAYVKDTDFNGKGYNFEMVSFEAYDEDADEYRVVEPSEKQMAAITKAMNSKLGVKAVEEEF